MPVPRAAATGHAVKRIGKGLRVFAYLPIRNKVVLIKLLPLFAVVQIGLRTTPLPRLARFLGVTIGKEVSETLSPRIGEADSGRPTDTTLDSPEGHRRVEAVVQVANLLFRGRTAETCLARSLLVGSYFRSSRPVLRIGVRAKNGNRGVADPLSVAAHAWLEFNEFSIGDAGDFLPLRRKFVAETGAHHS